MNTQQLIIDAETGVLKAQWDLSNMYYEGDGVNQDDDKAFYWTSKAALQGHITCLLYTSPSPRDRQKSRMPSSA